VLEGRASLLPIAFLSGRGDVATSVRAMKHGAVDFLTKPVEDEVLIEAVRTAFAGGRACGMRATSARVEQRLAALTARERQVLDFVLAGRLNKQIAAELGTAEKTVKFHRGNVVRKMGVRSVAELVRLVQGAGIGPAPRR
jgi:FixJ family two-component response regulator